MERGAHWVDVNLGIGTLMLRSEAEAMENAQEKARREADEVRAAMAGKRTVVSEL